MSVATATTKIEQEKRKMHSRTVILIVVSCFALAFNGVYSSPINVPAGKNSKSDVAAIQPSTANKLHELKTQAENHLSSKAKMPNILDKGSKLEGESASGSGEAAAPADSGSSDAVDGDDTASKADFWYCSIFVSTLYSPRLMNLSLQETYDWWRSCRYDGRR
jgi:hypothetical protein